MSTGPRVLLWSFLAFFLLLSVWHFWPEPEVEWEKGILCPEVPLQTPPTRKTPWLHGDFMVTALADYDIRARVLSREEYHSGDAADLSPVDFALGWGPMSDTFVIDKLDISQGHRWYKWQPKDLMPIPRKDIEVSSANVHILPANDTVRDLLDDVYKGSIVHMKGYLVKVTGDGGWHWQSSTKRTDTGNGACEVFWVETLVVENPES
jgi:hypothetical protein